jgi:hypothetical protein
MVILIISFGLVPSKALSSGDSIVIGRISGTYQPLPGYFYHNPDFLGSGGIDAVEFPGFRLLRAEDDKRFLIRPNHKGYFYQDLPGGTYTLTRKRNDRPDYKLSRTIEIIRFEVKTGTLVNLGTLNIVLEGKPDESLFHLGNTTRGRYIYNYSYERDSSANAYSRPLNWFRGKKRDVAASLGERVVQVDAAPTREKDGSRVTLRENRRFHDN